MRKLLLIALLAGCSNAPTDCDKRLTYLGVCLPQFIALANVNTEGQYLKGRLDGGDLRKKTHTKFVAIKAKEAQLNAKFKATCSGPVR